MEAYDRMLREQPGKLAVIMPSGAATTYGEFEKLVAQRTEAFASCGIERGQAVAIAIENSPEFLATAWAALRVGLIVVPMSTLLTAAEMAVIVADSEARLVIASSKTGETFDRLPACRDLPRLFCTGPAIPGYVSWTELCDAQPGTAAGGPLSGLEMLYSSGTTGRPKGIVYHGMHAEQAGSLSDAVISVAEQFGLSSETVYLCTAPLYHAAPYAWSVGLIRLGGTVVLMDRFDAATALRLIADHRVTVAQFVPTHFVRMLKLPEGERRRHDLTSLRLVLHSAAPCPVDVKRAIIDWLGPIVVEYFGSSEQSILTIIGSADWLAHPGSVGKAIRGKLHILDDGGREVSAGSIGQVYAEGGMDFSYHRDPARTDAARNATGWTTVGDFGFLDDAGYLYLTDRGAFLIITGGVNVYPQEIENVLVTHPAVADAAVVGVPDVEMGEIVTAVVQAAVPEAATPELAAELRSWLRERLSGAKVPKRIEFRAELPRLPTGKMKKHLLLDDLAGG